MIKNLIDSRYAALKAKLKIDCKKCSGLCCVALYCMKTDGFPENKAAGVPCKHLATDFRCDIHSALASKNMRGCLAYDCFGAGQKVTQECYPDGDWKTHPEKSSEVFQVFSFLFQFHQMEWYLLESLSLTADGRIKADIEALISENEEMTGRSPDEILHLDIAAYRAKVNQILKQVSGLIAIDPLDGAGKKEWLGKDFKRANLDGRDFSMALLIAANLEGCSLQGTNFLGADMRDANIRNTDLSASVYLTQMQVNAARGNSNTRLPASLSLPASWQE